MLCAVRVVGATEGGVVASGKDERDARAAAADRRVRARRVGGPGDSPRTVAAKSECGQNDNLY